MRRGNGGKYDKGCWRSVLLEGERGKEKKCGEERNIKKEREWTREKIKTKNEKKNRDSKGEGE